MIGFTKGWTTLSTALAACGLAVGAHAQVIVNADIAASTTWTANNTYSLQDVINVLPGATLTIEAGTVIASEGPGGTLGGALVITRGAQLNAQGTELAPIIFTSQADVATWDVDPGHPTGGDPTTGVWRESANEWGNVTMMGRAFISEDEIATNSATPSASNYAPMEGLVAASANDPNVRYGGGDDDDDSGTLSYVSIRYGGDVVALDVELNGLSLGGIGRGTDIHHVEIMNNVDDGIEIWGGTVNLKNVVITNIGDDSFDVDQGWRGKAQFGLITQGYSLNASQGSGVGDNCFETDGAEQSDYQPVTTAAFYNFTVIGQPLDGDHATAWRDNARVQYRNCVFQDIGDDLVGFDNVDGDGGLGYGHNGTLTWAQTWTTPAGTHSLVNPFPGDPNTHYTAQQLDGNLAEIRDSVFFRVADKATATAVGVFNPANNNVDVVSFLDVDGPLRLVVRENPPVSKGGKLMARVISLDPRAQNDAVTSVGQAPNDGFYTPAKYRGAFKTFGNWAACWTALDAFGFLAPVASAEVSRVGVPANPDALKPASTQPPVVGKVWDPRIDHTTFTPTAILDVLFLSVAPLNLPAGAPGTILIDIFSFAPFQFTAAAGANFAVAFPKDSRFIGVPFYTQGLSIDASFDFFLTNALDITVGYDG